ncbi:hypothetical protein [Methanobacterium petrolearium]|uniref:hypothetical protein n=1 Tax=Methanobacterium petrolearium TaxID=710190 RepID=UPI001AE9A7D6|nr:hypothetical protein [Methanobacterium petrolearium]MBP1945248.1 hypothetical protein [Methanobacterium petrolearium]
MRLDNRGMATAELIFATFIALVVIGAMLSMVNDEVNQSQVGNLGEARISGENIAEALNTVYINGNGYSVIIRLDPNPPFNAVIESSGNSSSLTIFTNGQSINIPIIPKRFNSSYNLTSGTNYIIKNNDGTIGIIEFIE